MINAIYCRGILFNFRFVRPARIAIGLSITVYFGGREYFCRNLLHALITSLAGTSPSKD